MIPKIIHQTWRSKDLPSIFQKIYDANKDLNGDEFEYRLWRHSPGPPDIDAFIKTEYPEIYDVFCNAEFGVQKADIARICILYHYGGVYYDLDILGLKPLRTLIDFDTENVYMAFEPAEQTKRIFNSDNVICNAFIAAPPKHPLFKQAMHEMLSLIKRNGNSIYKIFNVFGADLISKAMQSDASILKNCKFLNRKLIFPINDPKFSDLPSSVEEANMIKAGDYKGAYMVHYWIHSDFESKELLDKFEYNDDENIHDNVLRFFRTLYPSNNHIRV